MELKKLSDEQLKSAVKLKIDSWTEELAGVAENDLNVEEEYQFWLTWSQTAEEHHDVRLLYGMFDQETLTGAIFTSFAETYDHPNAIEINGLWVDNHYRNQHISTRLLYHVLKCYQPHQKDVVIVYNHRLSPSQGYYYHLGGKVIRSEYQMDGKLLVDVFLFDAKELFDYLKNKLENQ